MLDIVFLEDVEKGLPPEHDHPGELSGKRRSSRLLRTDMGPAGFEPALNRL